MTQQHPITPPPELVEQWEEDWHHGKVKHIELEPYTYIATRAAQWGADQELEACCEWLMCEQDRQGLRAARRPKPPSLKEQALALINHDPAKQPFLSRKGIDIIRRALESIPDDN